MRVFPFVLPRLTRRAFERCGPRYAPLAWLAAAFLALATLTRVALAIRAGADLGLADAPRIAVVGFGYDLATFLYAGAPFALWLTLFPERVLATRWHRTLVAAAAWAALFGLLFLAVGEWLFWEEFDGRFNFIAVDYLVYTREVLGNIVQSYPVGWILAAIAAIATVVFVASWPGRPVERVRAPRAALAAAWTAAVVVVTAGVDTSLKDRGADKYVAELSGNGLYELFAAFRSNEIDYARFYRTLPEAEVFAALRAELATREARFVSADPRDLTREIVHVGPERRLNVVLVSVESLSADYLGAFGNPAGLTPNLDRLAREGLLFTRLYATGTRTVRGLEALALAVPPTPGQSLVRRPHNEGLFSLASVFDDRGYESKYVYGGYAYFDNMSQFFGANGYAVVDRRAIPAARIHHETVWGVADEDLFRQVIEEMRASHAAGRRSFVHVMTTSNHRPYTYPDGRIDIPSGSGREGAVKYTDWAIGKFIADARAEDWFDDTMFVIVADHQAASAGKTGLPVDRYRIPLIVYAPRHVAPRTVDRLMSQIDVAPTVLGLLNFSYRSRFLGWDIFQVDPARDRAFVSTYQEMGFVDGGRLVSLRPRRGVTVSATDVPSEDDPDDTDADLTREAIAWYQGAGLLFRTGGLAALPNRRVSPQGDTFHAR
jgi:phosphoglycerol transferase MdoB-like AlkP superfamily enzyme